MSFTADEIEDLKQLLAANNRALMVEFDQKLDQKLDEKLRPLEERLNQKIDDLADFVRESLDISNETTGEQIADLDRRVTKLEQAAA